VPPSPSTSAAELCSPPTKPLQPSSLASKHIYRFALACLTSLAAHPSPPAIAVAGFCRSNLSLPFDSDQGLDCKDCNLF
jgi:hypothetical protein